MNQPRSIGDRSARDGRFRFRLTVWTTKGGRVDFENVEHGSATLYPLLFIVGCLAGLRKSTWKRWQRMADDAERKPRRKKA